MAYLTSSNIYFFKCNHYHHKIHQSKYPHLSNITLYLVSYLYYLAILLVLDYYLICVDSLYRRTSNWLPQEPFRQ